jgi:hypothetical protein
MSRIRLLADLDEVDRADAAAGVADRARDAPEHARLVVDLHPQGQAVLGGGCAAHHGDNTAASAAARVPAWP